MHTSVSSVLALLAQLKPPSPTLIAIDGHSASGKSSIARALHQVHPASTLVHTDDFYRPLPAHMRNGLDAAGGYHLYYDWQRLDAQVLRPLKNGRPARYQRYDWSTNDLAEWIIVLPTGLVIIEGCYAARPVEEGSSVTELREEFNEPSFDPVNCLRLYEHAPGELVGFAQLYVAEDTADNDGFLWFKVHPAHRTDRIEPQMFAWAEAQLRTRGRVKLRVTARDKERERQALIERHGFVPVRYFLRMRRALSEPIPVPVFPPGYHLRDGDHDPQAWADLYNDSFADHYNFHSHDAEFVRHWQSDPDYRADMSQLASRLPTAVCCTVATWTARRTGCSGAVPAPNI